MSTAAPLRVRLADIEHVAPRRRLGYVDAYLSRAGRVVREAPEPFLEIAPDAHAAIGREYALPPVREPPAPPFVPPVEPTPLPDRSNPAAVLRWFDAFCRDGVPLDLPTLAGLFSYVTGGACTCKVDRGRKMMAWRAAGCPREWEPIVPPGDD